MESEEHEGQRKRPWIRSHAWQVAKLTTGLVFAVFTAWFVLDEHEDRRHARIGRNWTVVQEMREAPGNQGQIAALEALYHDGVNLWHLDLPGAFLRGVRLAGADLTASSLAGADLRDADLGGTILTDANVSCADFDKANLRGAILGGANLTAADLRFALNLTQGQLDGACADPGGGSLTCGRGDWAAGFPEGLAPPPACAQGDD